MHVRIWGILGLVMKSMTPLYSAKVGVSSKCCGFSSCGLSWVLAAQWVPGRGREQFCDVRLGAKSLTPRPLTFSASLFCDSLVMVKIRHSWPTCVVSVFGGSRLTASNGRPRIGRVAQSKSKFLVFSLFVFQRMRSGFSAHLLATISWPKNRPSLNF